MDEVERAQTRLLSLEREKVKTNPWFISSLFCNLPQSGCTWIIGFLHSLFVAIEVVNLTILWILRF